MKSVLKYILIIFLIPLILVLAFLFYSSIRDFDPEEKILLKSENNSLLIHKSTFSLMSWNIGYAGLGENMDFFYDGGQGVRCSESETQANLAKIKNFLKAHKQTDFITLQEVDIYSKRSYYSNQIDGLSIVLPLHSPTYAENYKVEFVPVPISDPMGKVQAGLLNLSQFQSRQSFRFALPGNYAWPNSIFMLDRCFIADYYPLFNKKELIVINTHNSAYDDGSLKQQQLEFLSQFVQAEYKKGNYVIVAGDWNQNPPIFDISESTAFTDNKKFKLSAIDSKLFPSNWHWVFDANIPTNRSLAKPYKKGVSATTILDFFLLSPNLKANQIKTYDLNFINSDHNPIFIKFELND